MDNDAHDWYYWSTLLVLIFEDLSVFDKVRENLYQANFADPTCQFWLVFAGSRKIFTVLNFQKSKNYSKTKVYQIKLKKEVQIDIKQC